MKKIFLVALMSVFATTMFAQGITTNTPKSWGYIYMEYNPGIISVDGGKWDVDNFDGISLGYNGNFRIAKNVPLYLGTGVGLQVTVAEDEESTYILGSSYNTKYTFGMVSVKVPFNFGYMLSFPNAKIDVFPNTGLDFRFNTWGEAKRETNGNSSKVDVFSKDDMGDYAFNRVQIGAHIGVNARFWKHLVVGFSYQFDFNEIAEKTHVYQGNLMVGYSF